MGRDLLEDPAAAATVKEAELMVELPLRRLMLDGPEESLRQTDRAQPAIVLHCLLLHNRLRQAGITPDAVAGHSLGEFAALYAAESLAFYDTLQVVRTRGQAMVAAAPGGSGMVAVLGLPDARVDEVLSQQSGPDPVVAANYNAPGQVVISGTDAALHRVGPSLQAAGAKRLVPLDVSAAFHSPLMAAAATSFRTRWDEVALRATARIQVFNVDAAVHHEPAEIRELMIRQLTSPVRWTDCVRRLWERGVRTFVEVGPKRTLSALVKKIQPEAAIHNVEDLASLHAFVEGVHA